jgi:SAM-dependent methyltransferase
MTYGASHGIPIYVKDGRVERAELGSPRFFELADRQLLEWNRPLHTRQMPFGKIFPFEKYRNKDVLEIGCGMGAMAMFWARQGARITAVDLNPVAIEQTTRRFALYGLPGIIRRENAHRLSFPDSNFDYVYSWGVLHHSPDFELSASELFRVLRPGGEFGLMLYNRRSLLYGYHVAYLEGFLHGEARFLNTLQLASRYSDGHREEGNPHTWPLSKKEIVKIFRPRSVSLEIKILGTELDSTLKLLVPGLYFVVPTIVKKAWARRFGWSYWVTGRKGGA